MAAPTKEARGGSLSSGRGTERRAGRPLWRETELGRIVMLRIIGFVVLVVIVTRAC